MGIKKSKAFSDWKYNLDNREKITKTQRRWRKINRVRYNNVCRLRMKRRWDDFRSKDLCGLCGQPSKRFSLCFKHRVKQLKYNKAYRRRLRDADSKD